MSLPLPENFNIETDGLSLRIFYCSKLAEKKHLIDIFSKFGAVSDVKRVTTKEGSDVVYINFEQWKDMELAYCSMSGAEIDGTPIVIEFVSSKYAAVNEHEWTKDLPVVPQISQKQLKPAYQQPQQYEQRDRDRRSMSPVRSKRYPDEGSGYGRHQNESRVWNEVQVNRKSTNNYEGTYKNGNSRYMSPDRFEQRGPRGSNQYSPPPPPLPQSVYHSQGRNNRDTSYSHPPQQTSYDKNHNDREYKDRRFSNHISSSHDQYRNEAREQNQLKYRDRNETGGNSYGGNKNQYEGRDNDINRGQYNHAYRGGRQQDDNHHQQPTGHYGGQVSNLSSKKCAVSRSRSRDNYGDQKRQNKEPSGVSTKPANRARSLSSSNGRSSRSSSSHKSSDSPLKK